MLVMVASHLENDDASLVNATHVCHLWRTTLLSSPRLWSHLDFANEERALVFLERSKSAPLSVNLTSVYDPSGIVRKSLKKVTSRVIMLWALQDSFLDELLDQSMPKLEGLEIFDSDELLPKKPTHLPSLPTYLPSLTSLGIYYPDPLRFNAPILTSFHLAHNPVSGSMRWKASTLLNFLRNYPLLEDAFLSCDVDPDSDEVVFLPLLRSFTHDSPRDECWLYLLN